MWPGSTRFIDTLKLPVTELRNPVSDFQWSAMAFLSHFALGYLVAFLLTLSTLIMCSCFTAGPIEYSIRRYLFWLCLSLSIVVHVLEDYSLGWF